MVSKAKLGAEGGLQQAAMVRDLFLERWIFKSRSSNYLGTDLARTSGLRECAKAVNKTNLGWRPKEA